MYKKICQSLFVCAFLCLISINVNAQKKNIANQTLSISKKTAAIVIGKPAKLGFKATKFTASKIAKPIIVKSAPKIAKFLLKRSRFSIKTSLPIAKKVLIKYIKYKFLP